MKNSLFLLILWASALTFLNSAEPEMPEKMIKVVLRSILPPIQEGSFAAKPKTHYRIGSHYARLEESPDEAKGLHGLIISNNRDTWMINLLAKSGKHFIDQGVTYDVYMPLLPLDPASMGESPLKHFEIGHEIQFLKKHQALEKLVTSDGESFGLFQLTKDGFAIELRANGKPLRPYELKVTMKGKLVVALHYDEYLTELAPDMSLFQVPSGIAISEAK